MTEIQSKTLKLTEPHLEILKKQEIHNFALVTNTVLQFHIEIRIEHCIAVNSIFLDMLVSTMGSCFGHISGRSTDWGNEKLMSIFSLYPPQGMSTPNFTLIGSEGFGNCYKDPMLKRRKKKVQFEYSRISRRDQLYDRAILPCI